MNHSIFTTIIILFFSSFFWGCKETSTNFSTGQGNGNIYGYTYLLGSLSGKEITPRDFSSVSISVIGGAQTTLTDENGQFELQSVPTTGSYSLLFSKAGFAAKYDIDHQFSASHPGSLIEIYNTVIMYQIRRLTPNLVLRAFQSPSGADTPYTEALFSSRIVDTITQNRQFSGYIKLYFGKDELISPSNPNSFQFSTPMLQVDAISGIATISVFRDSLLKNGFTSNDKIYCAAYYCGFYTKNEFYPDKKTDKKIYTGLSPFHSVVRDFILP